MLEVSTLMGSPNSTECGEVVRVAVHRRCPACFGNSHWLVVSLRAESCRASQLTPTSLYNMMLCEWGATALGWAR